MFCSRVSTTLLRMARTVRLTDRNLGLYLLLGVFAILSCTSCTILASSPFLIQQTTIPVLKQHTALAVSNDGKVPYQRWRIPPWDDNLRYVWLVGDYDFRRHNSVEIVLYFHGMHAKDYYSAFRKELDRVVEQRPNRPFLFVGFVDGPYVLPESRSAERWKSLSQSGKRPDKLFAAINQVFRSFRLRFPNVKKEHTSIVLAGFSGGGRVLHAVGNWLAKSKDDPYAEVFRSRLTKIIYFDCWFEKDVLETVPTLLETNPGMKIVATVHMKKPLEHASILANKYGLKKNKHADELVGLDGRLVIYRDDSHWSAMIGRLRQAL
ncbi:MAG: hypothetical protein ACPL7J_12685 [Desulfomonilaceae bacterium]